MENKTLEAIEKYNKVKKELAELKEKIKWTESEMEKVTKEAYQALCNGKKWVFYDEHFYGSRISDWPMDKGEVVVLETTANLKNGDLIDDWTGKLGSYHVNAD